MKRWAMIRERFGLRTVWPALKLVAFFLPVALASTLDAGALGWCAAGGATLLVMLGIGASLGYDWPPRRLVQTNDEISVGADGVRVSGARGTRVVRWRDVDRLGIDSEGRTVFAQLGDGTREQWEVADVRSLCAAATTAFEDFRATRAAEAPAALAPPERDLGAWVDAVRSLLHSAADYRELPVTPEVLVRVAQDPSAPAGVRVASALALAAADEGVKARVRVAIEDVADPEVAELMTEALSGSVGAEAIARLSRRK